MPVIYRGETLLHARQRVLRSILWDPLLYIGAAFFLLALIQTLNSGCGLEYLPDADRWQISAAPVTWLPFSVERGPAAARLSLVAAAWFVVLAVRHGLGRAGRHFLVQMLVYGGGLVACVGIILARSGDDPWAAMATRQGALAPGALFAFLLIVAMGSLPAMLAKKQRTIWFFALLALFGNFVGAIFFAELPLLAPCLLGALFMFVYWLFYLPSSAGRGKALLTASVVLTAVAFVAGWLVLNPNSVAAERLTSALPVDAYWQKVSAAHPLHQKSSLGIWSDYPWRGCGVEGFRHFSALTLEPGEWELMWSEQAFWRNYAAEFLSEYGIIGSVILLLGLFALLISVLVRARRLRLLQGKAKEKGEWYLMLLRPGAFAILLALLVCLPGCIMMGLFNSPAFLLVWICVLALLPASIPEKIDE